MGPSPLPATRPPLRQSAGVLILALLALVGTITVLLVTRNGPSVSPDAVSYIGTARGLASGEGFAAPPGTPPVGHFAPLYPATLAGLDTLGIDPLDGARWLNALLLGATVLAVGLVLRHSTGAWWPGLVGGVLAVCATDVLSYYCSALSDPLFALLVLLALVALVAYLEERRPLLLGAATVLAGLAFLTRYAGVALVASGAIALVAYGAGRRGRGLLEAAIFSGAATLPVLAWVVWARSAHGGGSEGDVVVHPFYGRYLADGVANVFQWAIPDAVPWFLGAAALAGTVAFFMWAKRAERKGEPDGWRPTESSPAPGAQRRGMGRDPLGDGARPAVTTTESGVKSLGRLPLVCAVFAGAYLAVLLLDRLLLDASALLDKRLLLPLHLVAVVGLLAVACAPERARVNRDALKVATFGAVSLLVLLQLGSAVAWVHDSIDDGGARRGGYASRLWRDSLVVAAVRRLPPGVPVYTNGADAIWFLTGRSTNMLPAEEDYLTGQTNPRYDAQVAAMASRLRAERGLIVYFPAIKSRRSLPTVADLERVFPLQQVSSDPFGTIYAPST